MTYWDNASALYTKYFHFCESSTYTTLYQTLIEYILDVWILDSVASVLGHLLIFTYYRFLVYQNICEIKKDSLGASPI